MISNFTGDTFVIACVLLTIDDKKAIEQSLLEDYGITLHTSDLPSELYLERRQMFKSGDFKGSEFIIHHPIKLKTKGQKKWRVYADEKEKKAVTGEIYNLVPDIAYFPTFVFDFPKSIFLTERGGKIDQFYRSMFQDILDFDGKSHSIENDIVRRIRAKDMVVPWLNFIAGWSAHEDRKKVQHIMDRAGAIVTQVVFGRWNQIFGEDTKGKEVIISFEPLEGEKSSTNGSPVKTTEHDLCIKFEIRDGTRRFDVNDRSLGFRWFFAFLLFTQFRVAREGTRPYYFYLTNQHPIYTLLLSRNLSRVSQRL